MYYYLSYFISEEAETREVKLTCYKDMHYNRFIYSLKTALWNYTNILEICNSFNFEFTLQSFL